MLALLHTFSRKLMEVRDNGDESPMDCVIRLMESPWADIPKPAKIALVFAAFSLSYHIEKHGPGVTDDVGMAACEKLRQWADG